MVGLSIGILQPTAASAASCTSNVCTYSGANFTGTEATSGGNAGVCYLPGAIRSIVNNSSRSIVVYELTNCRIDGFKTRTVEPYTSVSSMSFTGYSYKSLVLPAPPA
ncbi:peptidase inhibitor family I36 protein [Micromonospora sp. NPDC049051]|uniref:peptidase inhibitor family I36 protein n=1 Tax=Micromonospora sp. NPDC049051 TaxID=3364264 RepID=UPI00371500E2